MFIMIPGLTTPGDITILGSLFSITTIFGMIPGGVIADTDHCIPMGMIRILMGITMGIMTGIMTETTVVIMVDITVKEDPIVFCPPLKEILYPEWEVDCLQEAEPSPEDVS